jgi:hypothetical protein
MRMYVNRQSLTVDPRSAVPEAGLGDPGDDDLVGRLDISWLYPPCDDEEPGDVLRQP